MEEKGRGGNGEKRKWEKMAERMWEERENGRNKLGEKGERK